MFRSLAAEIGTTVLSFTLPIPPPNLPFTRRTAAPRDRLQRGTPQSGERTGASSWSTSPTSRMAPTLDCGATTVCTATATATSGWPTRLPSDSACPEFDDLVAGATATGRPRSDGRRGAGGPGLGPSPRCVLGLAEDRWTLGRRRPGPKRPEPAFLQIAPAQRADGDLSLTLDVTVAPAWPPTMESTVECCAPETVQTLHGPLVDRRSAGGARTRRGGRPGRPGPWCGTGRSAAGYGCRRRDRSSFRRALSAGSATALEPRARPGQPDRPDQSSSGTKMPSNPVHTLPLNR